MFNLLLFSHIFGFLMGVAMATSSDIMFFRALRKDKISSSDLNMFRVLSFYIWVGLVITIISGILLVWLYDQHLLYSHRFWAKQTIVAIIFINGLVIQKRIYPVLTKSIDKNLIAEIQPQINLFSSVGSISIVSWYSALSLGLLKFISWPYYYIIGIYALLIIIGILVSGIYIKRFIKK